MRTIYNPDFIWAPKNAILKYGDEHHQRRDALFRGLAEHFQLDPTGERSFLLKLGDLTLGNGAICVEKLPISIVDMLPDEHEFRTEDTLTALNESPVLVMALQKTEPSQLRHELHTVSQAVDGMNRKDVFPYVVAVSYSELIRLAVRAAGMHPANIQSASSYIYNWGLEDWRNYTAHNYPEGRNPLGRQAPVYTLKGAFMSTVEFADLHNRL